MTIHQWLPLLFHLITVVLGAMAALHRGRQSQLEEASVRTRLTADVQYIRQAVDAIAADTKAHQQSIHALERRLIQAEEHLAHLESRVNGLIRPSIPCPQ